MVALFKKGDRHQASNYRPVALTSVSWCQLLCLDAHEVVVSLHGMLHPLALHQFCKKIHLHGVDVILAGVESHHWQFLQMSFKLLFLGGRRHIHSSWTTALTPSGRLSTHPGNPWKPSVCTAGTGGNTFFLELLKLGHLELHGVRIGIGKSIVCLYKLHWLHQLKQRQLCSSKYGRLEERFWHQWDVGSTYLGRRSRWSADERPTWYRVSVGGCTPGCHVAQLLQKPLQVFFCPDEMCNIKK